MITLDSNNTDLHLLSKEIQKQCKNKNKLTVECFTCIKKVVDYIYVSMIHNLENEFFQKNLTKFQHKLVYLYKTNKDDYQDIIKKEVIEDIVYNALNLSSNLNIKPFVQKNGGIFIKYCILCYEYLLFKELISINKLKIFEYRKLNNEILFNIDINNITDEIDDIIKKTKIDKLLTKMHLQEFKKSILDGVQYPEYQIFYDLIIKKIYD